MAMTKAMDDIRRVFTEERETRTRLVLTSIAVLAFVVLMPRTRECRAWWAVDHVLNRSVVLIPMFPKEANFEAFDRELKTAYVSVSGSRPNLLGRDPLHRRRDHGSLTKSQCAILGGRTSV